MPAGPAYIMYKKIYLAITIVNKQNIFGSHHTNKLEINGKQLRKQFTTHFGICNGLYFNWHAGPKEFADLTHI